MNVDERREGRKLSKKRTRTLLYIITIFFSVLFLVIGNKMATDLTLFNVDDYGETVVEAKVGLIMARTTENYGDTNDANVLEEVHINFEATITSGEEKGERVSAIQTIDNMYNAGMAEIERGDKVLLVRYEGQAATEWQFMEFVRTDKLLILGIIFVLALLFFGRLKGANTILSLFFTCGAIFLVFIPSILSGKNIYISTIIICAYAIVTTYLLVNGFNKKTLTAIIGCLGGIIVSGVLTVVSTKILALTGYIDEDSIYLTYLSTETPIDLKAIIFAAILIGAMGAIMDVAMSISSALWEVQEKADESSFQSLFKSGMNIGQDVMGTMANTLILAYIGGSLSVVLLLSAYSTSLSYLLNRELIVVEILQALVGSFGLLFTLPLTAAVCALMYPKSYKEELYKEKSYEEEIINRHLP